MAAGINLYIAEGFVQKDPSESYREVGENNTAFCRFNIAVPRPYNNKDGGKKEYDYITCIAFGKVAEQAVNEVGEGDIVEVRGRMQSGSYEKDGRKVYTTEANLDNLIVVRKKTNGGGNAGNGGNSGGQRSSGGQQRQQGSGQQAPASRNDADMDYDPFAEE